MLFFLIQACKCHIKKSIKSWHSSKRRNTATTTIISLSHSHTHTYIYTCVRVYIYIYPIILTNTQIWKQTKLFTTSFYQKSHGPPKLIKRKENFSFFKFLYHKGLKHQHDGVWSFKRRQKHKIKRKKGSMMGPHLPNAHAFITKSFQHKQCPEGPLFFTAHTTTHTHLLLKSFFNKSKKRKDLWIIIYGQHTTIKD